MKFKNKTTGVILIPSSEFVLNQLKKSTDFEIVKEEKKQEEKQQEKQDIKHKSKK